MSPDPAAAPRLQTCVECGKEVPLLIGGSCPDCFVGKTALLEGPQVLDVELCAHCDARHVGNHWVDPDEGMPLEWIREEAVRAVLKPHPSVADRDLGLVETAQDERNFRHHATLTGSVEGVPITFEKDLTVRMRRSVCDRCSRMFGGYYAAIIQLRATDRDVTEHEIRRAHRIVGDELDRQRANGNRESFLTKSGAVPGGFDYYLGDIEGTRAVARLLAERLGATYEEHAKLSGRKEGEDIYRVTFLVRIRLFAPGDFGLVGETPVQFQSVARGRAFVVRLSDRGTDKVDEPTSSVSGAPRSSGRPSWSAMTHPTFRSWTRSPCGPWTSPALPATSPRRPPGCSATRSASTFRRSRWPCRNPKVGPNPTPSSKIAK